MAIDCHLPPVVARVSLIWVSAMRGDGSPSNPERLINLYFNDVGELLACYDPLNGPPDSYGPGWGNITDVVDNLADKGR